MKFVIFEILERIAMAQQTMNFQVDGMTRQLCKQMYTTVQNLTGVKETTIY